MKLSEAIVGLEDLLVDDPHFDPERRRQAIKLGIEALKWRALMEHDYGSWCGPLLPGETKE